MIEQLLLHGATLYPIKTDVPDNEHCSNLGFTIYHDKKIINIRAISYISKWYSSYYHVSENYIGEFQNNSYVNTHKLPWTNGGYKTWNTFAGREDMRLVVWNDNLYGYATRVDLEEDKGYIELMCFDDNLNIKSSVYIDRSQDIEKNWMAIPDRPFTFIWWNNPLTIITIDPSTGKLVNIEKKPIKLGNIS